MKRVLALAVVLIATAAAPTTTHAGDCWFGHHHHRHVQRVVVPQTIYRPVYPVYATPYYARPYVVAPAHVAVYDSRSAFYYQTPNFGVRIGF